MRPGSTPRVYLRRVVAGIIPLQDPKQYPVGARCRMAFSPGCSVLTQQLRHRPHLQPKAQLA